MISSLGASLAGLQNASNRIDKAAQNIADPKPAPDVAGNAVQQDPTQDIVDLSIAAQDFKANAKVVQVEDKVTQVLLDIIA